MDIIRLKRSSPSFVLFVKEICKMCMEATNHYWKGDGRKSYTNSKVTWLLQSIAVVMVLVLADRNNGNDLVNPVKNKQ